MTETELEIMETLWENGKPLFLGELLEDFNARTQKNWKKQTINTFLFKMQQEKLVKAIEGERFKRYIPLISREEYLDKVTQSFLDRNYGGSFAKMFAMLSGGEKLDENEIEALRLMLEEWEKK